MMLEPALLSAGAEQMAEQTTLRTSIVWSSPKRMAAVKKVVDVIALLWKVVVAVQTVAVYRHAVDESGTH